MPDLPVGFPFFQLRDETLPQWLRRIGTICVGSDSAPSGKEVHPEIPGYRVASAFTYRGTTLDQIFRFYLPVDSTDAFPEFRAEQAVESILKRLGNPAHTPVRVWLVNKRGQIELMGDLPTGKSDPPPAARGAAGSF